MYHEQGDSCNVMVAASLAVETLDTMAYNFYLIYSYQNLLSEFLLIRMYTCNIYY